MNQYTGRCNVIVLLPLYKLKISLERYKLKILEWAQPSFDCDQKLSMPRFSVYPNTWTHRNERFPRSIQLTVTLSMSFLVKPSNCHHLSSTAMAMCSSFCPHISNHLRGRPICSFTTKPLSLSLKAFSSQASNAPSTGDFFTLLSIILLGIPYFSHLWFSMCMIISITQQFELGHGRYGFTLSKVVKDTTFTES